MILLSDKVVEIPYEYLLMSSQNYIFKKAKHHGNAVRCPVCISDFVNALLQGVRLVTSFPYPQPLSKEGRKYIILSGGATEGLGFVKCFLSFFAKV